MYKGDSAREESEFVCVAGLARTGERGISKKKKKKKNLTYFSLKSDPRGMTVALIPWLSFSICFHFSIQSLYSYSLDFTVELSTCFHS